MHTEYSQRRRRERAVRGETSVKILSYITSPVINMIWVITRRYGNYGMGVKVRGGSVRVEQYRMSEGSAPRLGTAGETHANAGRTC